MEKRKSTLTSYNKRKLTLLELLRLSKDSKLFLRSSEYLVSWTGGVLLGGGGASDSRDDCLTGVTST